MIYQLLSSEVYCCWAPLQEKARHIGAAICVGECIDQRPVETVVEAERDDPVHPDRTTTRDERGTTGDIAYIDPILASHCGWRRELMLSPRGGLHTLDSAC